LLPGLKGSRNMKAIVWTKYGPPDGLRLQEIEMPTAQAHEVLIKVHATSVTTGDCEFRSLKFPIWLAIPIRLWLGFRNPDNKILGQELAGEVVAVGSEVTQFKVGDAVFGTTGLRFGAHAEYACLPAQADGGVLAPKPTTMTYEEAAGVSVGGLEALHFLKQANIQPGEKVVIIGAGGSIGTMAVQLAKHFGAEVTAVDSGDKLDMLRSIGADHVIDYTREDFTQRKQRVDVIFDIPGKSTFSGCMRALKPGGRYLLSNAGLGQFIRARWASLTRNKKVILGTASGNLDDLLFLKARIEAGSLKSVIDRRYPLEQVPEAHRYVESGRKQGSVVITIV
jgi:NADPH:quinone reductase-like Zn-dependent oxidoreductase